MAESRAAEVASRLINMYSAWGQTCRVRPPVTASQHPDIYAAVGVSELAGESTGHYGHVQSQSRRDEKTMQIFIALLVFVGVLTGGAVLLVLAHLALGVGDEVAGAAFMAITASASVLAATYLVRHDRHG